MPERKPIFYDQERRRWRRTRRALEISGALFSAVLVIFLLNVMRNPDLPEILHPDLHEGLHPVRLRAKPRPARRHPPLNAHLGQISQTYDPVRAAFYVAWDANSLASLKLHYRDIDLLIPESLHAVSPDGSMDEERDSELVAFLRSSEVVASGLKVMPMVNNYDGREWVVDQMAAMLASPAARENLSRQLAAYAQQHHDPGIVVDFELMPQESQANFSRFVHDLGQSLHAVKLQLMVALPAADWSYDYQYIASQADHIVLMNYDFHYPASPPGPIAPQDWFVRDIRNILKIVPAQKIVMGVANYCYDWPVKTKANPRPVAAGITFQQALITSLESESSIDFDSDTLNPHFSYEDDNNLVHEVWMLDALTAYNELRVAERADVYGTAIWRLGTEDPSLWDIQDATHPTEAIRDKLKIVPPGYDLILEGDGDIWTITAEPNSGSRNFTYDPATDLFTDESFDSFDKYPLTWRIQQMGAAKGKLALTFDDGPDPSWTPKILDVLRQKKATATFFVIGEEANQYASLIRREFDAANEIGNHTFTHPDFEHISKGSLQVELNLNELLLESYLGVKTLLFRPPYGIDHQPETADEIQMLPIPQEMGYVIVGARIDPHDWGDLDPPRPPPPADVIVQRVVQQAVQGPGNIILMHDGGGDRSHTVAALPQVIDQLRARGFQFVSVSDLLGQTRAQMMITLSPKELLFARSDAFIFDLFRWLRQGIAFIFIAGIILVGGRALVIGLLALVEKLRPAPKHAADYQPAVSVLIPAFNEQAVIVDTVQAALASNYPRLEVIVVDDGSQDRTAELVRTRFDRDPRVRLLLQSNHGKPSALNHGLAEAAGEIIVSIDADTVVDPEAIARLVRHFADPKVGAVAGNVKVMNRNRWITRWQALEYITSQNLEKRAFDLLNCIPVVPGASGAWRASVLRERHGFSGDTVAEDTDLTLTIRRDGWKILYDEDAIGRTEVPETVEALVRQRFRWTFGTLQAVWKHRDTAGKPRYGTLGWIAIPNIFVFQILLPLVSPIIDLLFALSLVLWLLAQYHVGRLPQLWTSQDVERSLIFFALFMVIDLFTCVVAFALERHEDWTLLAPLLLQRFYYRQMMYWVIFRAIKEAVAGRPVGWRGVEPAHPAAPRKPHEPVATS